MTLKLKIKIEELTKTLNIHESEARQMYNYSTIINGTDQHTGYNIIAIIAGRPQTASYHGIG